MAVAAPKNIVLCFDGTGDWAGVDSTNVLKIFEAMDPNGQLAYYDGGVGTLDDPSQMTKTGRTVRRVLDLALATGLRDIVLEGYSFLIDNYDEGDRIFVFGFSRGAYTARVLAGFLYNFGLLRAEHENLNLYLWQTFSDFKMIEQLKSVGAKVKRDFSRPGEVPIHFMGLFDTVSSVGVLQRFKTFPNTDYNPWIQCIRHAVSIDEQRNVFPESLFKPDTPGLLEVWFPGVHRDVGGGYLPAESGLPNVTLQWILEDAARAGLKLKPEWTPPANEAPAFHFGAFDIFVLGGLYPFKMWSNLARGFRTFWPDFTHVRPIPDNALIHCSVKGLVDKSYRPMNLPKDPRYFDPATDSPEAQAKYYMPPMPGPNTPDFVGITLGVAVSLILILWIAQAPLSTVLDAWVFVSPNHSGWWIAGLFLLYIVSQGVGQKLNNSAPKLLRIPTIAPILGAVAAIAAGYFSWHWNLLGYAALFGALVWALAQLPPKVPVLRADRVLPFFSGRWIWIAGVSLVLHWVFPLLARLADLTPRLSWFSWLGDPFGDLLLGWITLLAIAIAVLYAVFQVLNDRRIALQTLGRAEAIEKPSIVAKS